jgi:integrase/recombinase XerD
MIASLRPKSYQKYLSLPVVGSTLDELTTWYHHRGFTMETMRNKLRDARLIDAYFQQAGAQRLEDLSQSFFEAAWNHYRHLRPETAATIRQMEYLLREEGRIDSPPIQPKTRIDIELDLFFDHLHRVRGLEPSTIRSHKKYLQEFLVHIRYHEDSEALTRLTIRAIEDFTQICAKRMNRYSLQHVIGYLRAFLRFQYEKCLLQQPLHTMIDTPRIYRLERLPRHLSWETVKQLLSSIDTTQPHGLRDYTMLFLVATYGFRTCEVASLTLDDIGWRAGTIRTPQRKTAQELVLPLTDAAGDVLVRYLKESRPNLPYRQLFLRVRAPLGTLKPTAVTEAFQLRVRLSGLDIPYQGPHCLRHSYATHLLRQGASVKAIGDLLGHRNAESTCVYLRLATEELRTIALPVPEERKSEAPIIIGPATHRLTKEEEGAPRKARVNRYNRRASFLSSQIEQYLQLKRSLGRDYSREAAILYHFDAFIGSYYPLLQDLTGEMFTTWSSTLEHLSPTVRRNQMRVVRNLCLYRQRSHPDSFVPDPLNFPANHQGLSPCILSESDIARLLDASRYLQPSARSPLRSESLRVGILLLFTAGLRRRELLRLNLGDFNSEEGTLLIRATKFHKSRILPLSPSVHAQLMAYLALRNKKRLPMETASPLIWNQHGSPEGRGYTGTGFARNWRLLCTALEIFTEKGRPPRIHDLRHSFAVNALKHCYINGEDVRARVPLLSTYMGHVSVASTHYYLSFVEEIRSEASKRFHQRFGQHLFTGMEDLESFHVCFGGGGE